MEGQQDQIAGMGHVEVRSSIHHPIEGRLAVRAIAKAQRRRIAIQVGPEHLPQGGAAELVALSIPGAAEAQRPILFGAIQQRAQRPRGSGPCAITAIEDQESRRLVILGCPPGQGG